MVLQECGCETEYDHCNQMEGGITYCPMHKAAPKMLATLREIFDYVVEVVPIEAGPIERMADEGLAHARGQEVGT